MTPWTIAHQAPLSMGFSRQEHWSWLPCPPPGDLPDSGIKSTSLGAPTLEAESLPLNHKESPIEHFYIHLLVICMSLLEKRLFRCSVYLNFLLSCMSFYIVCIITAYQINVFQFFPHEVSCLSVCFSIPWLCRCILVWYRALVYFCFGDIAFGIKS